jgi:coproporphyrinogen III oxidase-like Fe-S oxidoreductase
MAQLALEAAGYHELPNDFWARDVGDPATFRPQRLPSAAATLPIGPGAYGYYSRAQLCNVFDLAEYGRRVAAGRSPLWRAYRLDDATAFRRDVMFALKNDPYIDCSLFRSAYNTSPMEAFAPLLERLAALELLTIEADCLRLTPKGRLCVEEIAWLFRDPTIGPAVDAAGSALLAKHNFAPSYPPATW